jgi:hypothetical protein
MCAHIKEGIARSQGFAYPAEYMRFGHSRGCKQKPVFPLAGRSLTTEESPVGDDHAFGAILRDFHRPHISKSSTRCNSFPLYESPPSTTESIQVKTRVSGIAERCW